MRVQHPDKSQYTIAPAGETAIETDDRGIAEVPDKLGKHLVKDQGWSELKGKSKDDDD